MLIINLAVGTMGGLGAACGVLATDAGWLLAVLAYGGAGSLMTLGYAALGQGPAGPRGNLRRGAAAR